MLLIDLNYLLFVTKIQHKVPNHRCLIFNWLDLVICLIAYASLTQPGTPQQILCFSFYGVCQRDICRSPLEIGCFGYRFAQGTFSKKTHIELENLIPICLKSFNELLIEDLYSSLILLKHWAFVHRELLQRRKLNSHLTAKLYRFCKQTNVSKEFYDVHVLHFFHRLLILHKIQQDGILNETCFVFYQGSVCWRVAQWPWKMRSTSWWRTPWTSCLGASLSGCSDTAWGSGTNPDLTRSVGGETSSCMPTPRN